MPLVLSDLQTGVLTLTLNRTERANAFSLEMIAELQAAFKQAARDAGVRVVVLTGSGHSIRVGVQSAFCVHVSKQAPGWASSA